MIFMYFSPDETNGLWTAGRRGETTTSWKWPNGEVVSIFITVEGVELEERCLTLTYVPNIVYRGANCDSKRRFLCYRTIPVPRKYGIRIH